MPKPAFRSRLLAICTAVGLAAIPAAAQAAAEAPPASAEDEALINEKVTVTARRPDQTRTFVEEMISTPPSADQLARWDDEICTSIIGLPADHAQYIADRIAARAIEVGLKPGKPGCDGSFAIIVTDDSDTLSKRMAEENRDLFAYYSESNTTTAGRAAFDDFVNQSRPVRWWHIAQTVSADGVVLEQADGQINATGSGITGAPTVRSDGSRLRASVRQDLARVIIIVDSTRVKGVSLDALSDYLALVGLAQIDPNAESRALPSIINLFSTGEANGEPLTGMTDWDTSFLRGLYKAKRNSVSLTQQQNDIASRMRGN